MIARLLEALFGRGSWMQTFSGRKYYPCRPHAEDVRIVDIAHALSNLCRYTGACRKHYSVAEHSVLVSYCVPAELALEGLLHDAEEAYTNDIARPLKRSWLMWGYRVIARRNWLAVAEKFGLPSILSHEVHAADTAVALAERATIMCTLGGAAEASAEEWAYAAKDITLEAADVQINCWEADVAETEFLNRFYELTRGLPTLNQIYRGELPSCNFGLTGASA